MVWLGVNKMTGMVIKSQDLTFQYSAKKKIFQALSFELEAGHIYGLLGKNGVGKTTLLKLLSGLLFPSSGSIHVAHWQPRHRQASFLEQIFFLPEEHTMPALTGKCYMEMTRGFYPFFSEGTYHDVLKMFAMTDKDRLDKMSFGQKKKFLIAFGLATNTPIFILDEPTNGLDIPSKAQLRQVLREKISSERLILISTHQARDLQEIITALVVLEHSEVMMQASLAQLHNYLGMYEDQGTTHVGVIYREYVGSKSYVLTPRDDTQKSEPLDLEFLFGAVLHNREALQKELAVGENNHD
jgi:ABC-2 type transport system ATP-binding protein